jgi:hypothetical protein
MLDEGSRGMEAESDVNHSAETDTPLVQRMLCYPMSMLDEGSRGMEAESELRH